MLDNDLFNVFKNTDDTKIKLIFLNYTLLQGKK